MTTRMEARDVLADLADGSIAWVHALTRAAIYATPDRIADELAPLVDEYHLDQIAEVVAHSAARLDELATRLEDDAAARDQGGDPLPPEAGAELEAELAYQGRTMVREVLAAVSTGASIVEAIAPEGTPVDAAAELVGRVVGGLGAAGGVVETVLEGAGFDVDGDGRTTIGEVAGKILHPNRTDEERLERKARRAKRGRR